MSEHKLQCEVVKWARDMEVQFPELALLHAIPNGSKRTPAMAAWMKAEGLKRGVPDLCLPVRRKGYSGLYIEMKKTGGKVGDEQKAWRDALQAQGFAVFVSIGSGPAIKVLEEYLSLGAVLTIGPQAARSLIQARDAADRKSDLAKWRRKNGVRKAA